MKLNLTVLNNLTHDKLFDAFVKSSDGNEDDFYSFLSLLYDSDYEEDFYGYVQKLILCDDNAFSRKCAEGKIPSDYLKAAYICDLSAIFGLLKSADTRGKYEMNFAPTFPFPDSESNERTLKYLRRFYSEHGYGIFIDNCAFTYDNGLVPIENVSKISLSELKDYKDEKKLIESNVTNFISDLPYSNMLLYGDKGTGKSSTVHAILNKYAANNLKLVEINKEDISRLSEVSNAITKIPLKFIIFIDDLSVDENDDLFGLKASLEGSLSATPKNAMIVATSNRRHIVKENLFDRENAIHERDALEEQLSLSDRFGLTVMFQSTDKEQYLSIVKQLAADLKLQTNEKTLCELAERWAVSKGGRSPRRAKQFIELLYSCEVKGEEIDF